MAVALRDVEAAILANDGSPPITRTTFPTCRAHLYGAFFVKTLRKGSSFSFASFFVRSGARFFAPPHKYQTLWRAGAVKVGRRANIAMRSHHCQATP
jgi:hypothetical protein